MWSEVLAFSLSCLIAEMQTIYLRAIKNTLCAAMLDFSLSMADPPHNYTRLPGRLRNELGISKAEYERAPKSRNGPERRKEQRKAARLEKKTKHIPSAKPVATQHKTTKDPKYGKPVLSIEQPYTKAPKSILKNAKVQPIPSPPHSPPQKVTRRARDKLAQDDAEIAALERVLGVKDGSRLPKTFGEDGLDDLLGGLDDNVNALGTGSKKRLAHNEDEWLKSKRRKVQDGKHAADTVEREDVVGQEEGGNEIESLSESDIDEENGMDSFAGYSDEDDTSDGLGEEHDLENDNAFELGTQKFETTRPPRENPYVAPVSASTPAATGKYVPPSLRTKDTTETEKLSALRKQIQGLLNRLSEANILSVVKSVEKIYQTNPRQHVSGTIIDVLLGLLSDPSPLQDAFIILHAGFIAALYKKVGIDFGAQAVKRIDEEFSQHYDTLDNRDIIDKRLIHLISLIAELYNFQVVGSALVFDFIRLFLNELSETNTELLLKIIRNAGSQLRRDDPSTLTTIVQSLQEQISRAGEGTISIKMKFMMETLNSLKNNRMKTGVTASTISSEHLLRMKKTLGTFNQGQVKASEPLRISLMDLRESDRRGKCWLVGSGNQAEGQAAVVRDSKHSEEPHDSVIDTSFERDQTGDLIRLAREQRMNTSVRQSIFVAILSATDCNDAHLRLIKLHLKKSQELEIPKVVIHCSGCETVYNPFYTLLARKLCSDRKLKMAFQFSLWDIFKQIGEGGEESDEEDQAGVEKLDLRAIVNLSRMFGSLIADGGLGLGVLKNLDFVYLQSRAQTFVEILLVTTILQSQKTSKGTKNEAALIEIFLKPKEMTEMASGLQYFLKKKIKNSDVAGNKHDMETVKWGCRVATSALAERMKSMVYET